MGLKHSKSLLAFVAGTLIVVLAPDARAAGKCEGLKSLAVPGLDLTVTKAEMLPAGPPPPSPVPGPPPTYTLPARCYVEGVIDPHIGTDGKNYGIGFAVALPANWNGRFLFQGGGGLDGFLLPPIGATAAGDVPALVRGFAVASTDSGHKATNGFFDSGFFADQQATVDFEYASIGTVTRLAKQVVTQFYGKPATHSYFSGCSMGGREAMVAAQRYPLQFDGVIVGAPAMHVAYSGIGDRFVSATLAAIAPKGADGKPDATKALSDADRKAVIGGLLAACDGLDGVKDGMIFNVAACKFDPATLVCKAKEKPGSGTCITAAQAMAIKKAFAGPKDKNGHAVYSGFYYDTGVGAGGFAHGLLNQTPNPMGPPTYATEIDVDSDAAAAAADPTNAVGDTANWVNLSSYFGRGGKLLFFHGVSDPWFSAMDTVGYYQRMAAANGGMTKVRAESSRMFLSPGMGHCGGGDAALDNFDLLTPLMDWVEQGKAPESAIATGRAFPGRSRPLCAWPQHGQYKGEGDVENAASFQCRD